jgi:cGMP-dependent protein kinase 1
VKVFLKIMQE